MTTEKAVKSRVQWGESEQYQIVEKACEILEKEHCGFTLKFFHRAMKDALSEDRWRKVISFSNIDWFKATTKRRLLQREDERKNKPISFPVDLSVPPKRVSEETLAQAESLDIIVEAMRRILVPVFSECLSKTTFLDRITSQISVQVISAMRSQLFSLQVVNEQQAPPKKKSILIANLLNDQIAEVKREFSETFELNIIESGKGSASTPLVTQNIDFAIIMTRFVDHSTQKAIQNSGVKIVWCNGAVSDLKSRLKEIKERK